MQDRENFESYEIKYAVPSHYDLYKSGGSTLKDDKRKKIVETANHLYEMKIAGIEDGEKIQWMNIYLVLSAAFADV